MVYVVCCNWIQPVPTRASKTQCHGHLKRKWHIPNLRHTCYEPYTAPLVHMTNLAATCCSSKSPLRWFAETVLYQISRQSLNKVLDVDAGFAANFWLLLRKFDLAEGRKYYFPQYVSDSPILGRRWFGRLNFSFVSVRRTLLQSHYRTCLWSRYREPARTWILVSDRQYFIRALKNCISFLLDFILKCLRTPSTQTTPNKLTGNQDWDLVVGR